jgi:hypothetical protein
MHRKKATSQANLGATQRTSQSYLLQPFHAALQPHTLLGHDFGVSRLAFSVQ